MTLSRLREVALIAFLLGGSFLILRASSKKPGELTWLDRGVLRVSAPLQSAVAAAARGTGDAWSNYINLVDVRRENLRLVEDNRGLKAELQRTRLLSDRQAHLEHLLALRAEVPSETMAARVVGIETSVFYRVLRLRLDRGLDEVKPGMVVLVPEGVVGRISRVYGPYSDVLLAVDPESAIDVQVVRTGARGVLKGMSGDNRYRAHIPEMPRGEEAREGDELVTSGIGGFPPGVSVGAITKVVRPDAGLWQEVVVSPSVDFGRLAQVLVLLTPPPPPDPEARADGKRAPEPRRGWQAPR